MPKITKIGERVERGPTKEELVQLGLDLPVVVLRPDGLLDVELHSDHENKPPGVIDIVVEVGGVEVFRVPYVDDGLLSYWRKVQVDPEKTH